MKSVATSNVKSLGCAGRLACRVRLVIRARFAGLGQLVLGTSLSLSQIASSTMAAADWNMLSLALLFTVAMISSAVSPPGRAWWRWQWIPRVYWLPVWTTDAGHRTALLRMLQMHVVLEAEGFFCHFLVYAYPRLSTSMGFPRWVPFSMTWYVTMPLSSSSGSTSSGRIASAMSSGVVKLAEMLKLVLLGSSSGEKSRDSSILESCRSDISSSQLLSAIGGVKPRLGTGGGHLAQCQVRHLHFAADHLPVINLGEACVSTVLHTLCCHFPQQSHFRACCLGRTCLRQTTQGNCGSGADAACHVVTLKVRKKLIHNRKPHRAFSYTVRRFSTTVLNSSKQSGLFPVPRRSSTTSQRWSRSRKVCARIKHVSPGLWQSCTIALRNGNVWPRH